MAKRSTTGGPRTRRVTEADLQRRREYLSRAERERLWQRRALITIGVLVGISLVILAIALIYENLIRPREAVSVVEGHDITTADFEERALPAVETGQQIRDLYALTGDINVINQYASQLTNPISIAARSSTRWKEILIEEEAQARGITIDEAAVDKRVDEYLAQSYGLTLPGARHPHADPKRDADAAGVAHASRPSPTTRPPPPRHLEDEEAADEEATEDEADATPEAEPTTSAAATATATLTARTSRRRSLARRNLL